MKSLIRRWLGICPQRYQANNAWWRWIRSGQRNPPVITKTADVHCDRLFKIAHFQTRPLLFSNTVIGQANTHRPVPSQLGRLQFEIRTVSKSEQRSRRWMWSAATAAILWFPDPDGLDAPPPLGPLLLAARGGELKQPSAILSCRFDPG